MALIIAFLLRIGFSRLGLWPVDEEHGNSGHCDENEAK